MKKLFLLELQQFLSIASIIFQNNLTVIILLLV